MRYLRQSTASQSRSIGPFVDDTDFKTEETALSIANTDIKLLVNGGASANKNSGGGTHRANGVYGITFDATDTATVGELRASVKVAGALAVWETFCVLEEAVYDALFAASAPGYLQPTTAGRTLDVSAGGEAGVDWANVGSPTTVVGLTGTTVKTATDVETDTQDIQARLPAALVSGRIDASVGAMAAAVLTAAAIAADAITAAKVADGTIDAATFAAGAINAAAIAADAITAAKIADGAIDAATFAASAINAAAIAADAITAAKIADGAIDAATFAAGAINAAAIAADAITDAKVAADVTIASVTGAVGSVTGNVGGNVTGSVGSVAAGGIVAASFAVDAIDAAALKADAVTEIWASATRTLTGSQGIKKNTAKAAFPFAMTDSTTHAPATGLTVTATRSLDGAAFAACTNAVVEVSAGWYKIDLAAADLNGDTVALKFTAVGADQLNISLVTGA